MTKKRPAARRTKATRLPKLPTATASVRICSTARAARMPSVIHPMLATLVDDPFSDPQWIFETKWDGFRSICFISGGKARFVSRNQIEMTPQYPELYDIAKQIAARQPILDRDIVALDEPGLPRLQLLQ